MLTDRYSPPSLGENLDGCLLWRREVHTAVLDEPRARGSLDFGTLLRRYRLSAGLSQESLAERARMSTNGIGALERGARRAPQRETLALLANALVLDDEQRSVFEAAAGDARRRRSSSAAGLWPDAPASNLPIALTSFVGREAELDEIAALVRDHRLVTLTGSGGVGKTQTALQVGTALSDASDCAVCFVALAPVGPSLVVAAIASTLRVQEVPSRPLLDTLVGRLKNKAQLLILDNCEHVIGESATVADSLLAGCPRLRILATSREPLRAAGEYTYRLPSLSFPKPEAVALGVTDAAAYGAIALFTDRAQAVDHHFTLTDENAPIVGALCGHLDGIPLAIELAAARVNLLPVAVLAEKLEDRFRILAGGERTALPRQQTMRATIDWSYNLLSPPEQRVFERCSVFAGGCTLATAAAVCAYDEVAEDDVLELLSLLVDKSLVVADFEGDEPRYRLLESFRQYAREKLAARGETEVLARRHALACLELTKELDARDAKPGVWRTLAQEELDNWRAALQWALSERGDVLVGQRLAGGLSAVWGTFAPREGQRWIASAFELADEQTDASVLARLDYAKAFVAHFLGEYKEQLSSSQKAIERYRLVGDELGVARAQSWAGHALAALGRAEEAKAVLQEALEAARSLGVRKLTAYTLRCLAYVSSIGGDVAAARGYVAQALPIFQAMGAKLDAVMTMDDLGEYEFRAGNPELALRVATDALASVRESNDVRIITIILNEIATYLISLARYDEAGEHAREALDLARAHHWDATAACALAHLGAIDALRRNAEAKGAPTAYERPARILGFVDARLAAIGSALVPIQQPEHDRILALLRDTIGAETIAGLITAGASMTEEQAVEEAMEV